VGAARPQVFARLHLEIFAEVRKNRRALDVVLSMATHPLRRRFWIELGLGAASLLVLIVTILWHDWVEIVFGVDPDQGSGLFEWLVVALTIATTLLCSALARAEWGRRADVR
jgi:hypothetical protein